MATRLHKREVGGQMLLSNLKMFKRQVLILTATVFKMSVLREKRRTLEKANGMTQRGTKQKKMMRETYARHLFKALSYIAS